mmetsp:Transcript_26680/g.43628  ORF Transcript_26680/g.43628 Transcript_26680/m.43628 type:complete len:213 (+) Transcript_26680:84-722(+)|eukprot:CAMPEP_0184355198 /NCGR_PEP_ID=MMETSP1089-20130417/94047_1 /TAXON_ID=38269 ORGANISM="Gloeochaete wittrockiana, Strain SAG46.84" /NCGR_SAMPLE_ID=MMETSP1089 /ASSEMBLY_ACC=CAM_ASM_000445 /LENGTH=212 /DNA_ID=CAMNT_0026691701 /DNA_START=23 /DNA_END=661 /DNA_ORIENTATION=-
MKVTSNFIKRFHLDKKHRLLNCRGVLEVHEFFSALDIRNEGQIDDVQFLAFMQASTDLPESQIYKVFDMFDVDDSGYVEFDEFYLLFCMLVAIKDREEKQFMYCHSRTCFELLDEDGNKSVGIPEFMRFGFVFNFSQRATRQIFKEFDVDGSKELDYEEFRMFTLAAIDKQQEMEREQEKRMLAQQWRRERLTALAKMFTPSKDGTSHCTLQ